MKLSTGQEAFPIEFDNGDKENIYFNPYDPDLAIRLMECGEKANKRIEQIQKAGEENKTNAEFYKELRQIMCEEINEAFGSDVSSVVFKYCSPFATVNGVYYVILFIEAITPEIEKRIKRNNGKVQEKMNQYVAKYNK